MFIIKDLERYGLGYVKEWPVKGRPVYTPYRDTARQFRTRLEASRYLNYRTYWTGVARTETLSGIDGRPGGAECNLRLGVVERDA